MNDIARRAGVHQTTVSRALRNDPHLPSGTRERLQRLAREMGYRPNPLVSALVALRRLRRPPSEHSCLAYIVRDAPLLPACRLYLAGARAAAMQLGYRVEVFRLGTGRGDEGRLDRTLQTRGIQGLIIAPLPEARGHFTLGWDHFSTVVIEHSFVQPSFDRVLHDSYGGMRAIMAVCRRCDWQRAGLVLSTLGHERTDRMNGAAYLIEQQADAFFAPIPPLIMPTWNPAGFAAWQLQYDPEVVITSNDFLAPLHAAQSRLGCTNGSFRLVNINAAPGGPVDGIAQAASDIGAIAVRLVVEKLNRNERGVPAMPNTVLTPGRWVQGTAENERQLAEFVPEPAAAS